VGAGDNRLFVPERGAPLKDAIFRLALETGLGPSGSAPGAVSEFPRVRFPGPPRRTGRAGFPASGSPRIVQAMTVVIAWLHGVRILLPRYW
jgi:hypothetical protein